jgi:hypothetical protein
MIKEAFEAVAVAQFKAALLLSNHYHSILTWPMINLESILMTEDASQSMDGCQTDVILLVKKMNNLRAQTQLAFCGHLPHYTSEEVGNCNNSTVEVTIKTLMAKLLLPRKVLRVAEEHASCQSRSLDNAPDVVIYVLNTQELSS